MRTLFAALLLTTPLLAAPDKGKAPPDGAAEIADKL